MSYSFVILFDTYLGFGIPYTLILMLVTDVGDEICNKLSRFRLTFEKNVGYQFSRNITLVFKILYLKDINSVTNFQ